MADKALLIHGCFFFLFGWLDFHSCWHIGGSLSSPAVLELSGQTGCYSDQYLSIFWCTICFAMCLFLVRFGWVFLLVFYKCLFPSPIRGSSCMERSWCCWDMETVWQDFAVPIWHPLGCRRLEKRVWHPWILMAGSGRQQSSALLFVHLFWMGITSLHYLFKFWICLGKILNLPIGLLLVSSDQSIWN